LEKSRVVYQQGGERNFHFFYNLLAGASSEEANALTLYEAKYFYYVNQGSAFTVDGMNDREDYNDVRVSPSNVSLIFYLLSSIFYLLLFFFLFSEKI